jgi:hypothetical protein
LFAIIFVMSERIHTSMSFGLPCGYSLNSAFFSRAVEGREFLERHPVTGEFVSPEEAARTFFAGKIPQLITPSTEQDIEVSEMTSNTSHWVAKVKRTT